MKAKKIVLTLLASMVLGLASCNVTPGDVTSSEEAVSSSEKQLVDYAAQCKLVKDYQGKSFMRDGIGRVDLVRKIDGDTAHFYPYGQTTGLIKVRYNCIDTPESTGMIEPYGYGASDRNGELLKNAKTIVLSTDPSDQGDKGDVPVTDSTGGRYLAYVWVSEKENASYDELRLVNLILVQEGWSKQKGASGKQYAPYFLDANQQAMDEQLKLWSPEDDTDPRYLKAKAESKEVSLQNICESKDATGEEFDWVGSKATFVATVAATGPDTGAAYLADDIDGKRYGIYVFTQYKVLAPLNRIGNRIKITGTVARYGEDEESGDQGTLQLVDAKYSGFEQEGDIEVISRGDGTFTPLTGELSELECPQNINNIVEVKGLTCYGGKGVQDTASPTAYAFTLYCKDAKGTEVNIRIDDSMAFYPGEEPGGDRTKRRITNYEYFTTATNIDVMGAMVTYYGRYQIKLCSRQGMTVTGADATKAYL